MLMYQMAPVNVRKIAAAAEQSVDELAEIFKILGDPTRLRLLAALTDGGEMCVHELCARLGMSQTAVSHQLRTLREARLVRPRRAGREIFYALDDEHVVALLQAGLRHAGHGGA
jgi:DNA-binding transcriptional ArsR family regulator